jgi:hypothetical protein
MVPVSAKVAMGVMVLLLVFIAAFCYELGCSANAILPGRGNAMITLAAASAVFTVLAAMNMLILHKRTADRKEKKKRKR